MAMLLLVRRYLRNVSSQSRSACPLKKWLLHEQMLRDPPTDRMRDVRMLHRTQSVTMLNENSALRHNMPQRNDEEGGKMT